MSSTPGEATRNTALGFTRNVALSFVEARPLVLGVFLLRFVVGAGLTLDLAATLSPRFATGTVAWLLAVWAVYLVNGISDRRGDAINGSHRPLASGRLSPRFACRWLVVLAAASLLAAVPVGAGFIGCTLGMLALGAWYSFGRFAAKRWAVEALLVAAAGAFLTYVAGVAAVGRPLHAPEVTFAAVAAAWIAVAGHTKDFGDVDGDREMGRRTLPTILGDRAGDVVAGGTVAVGAVAAACSASSPQLLPLLLLSPMSLVVAALLLSSRSMTRSSQKRPYRVFMLTQYGLNLVTLVGAL